MHENETLTNDLDAKQARAIRSLLAEPTIGQAAKAAKVSEVTLWRWMQIPQFMTAYRQAQSALLESTLTALQAASVGAVETLREIAADKEAPPAVRVSAAKSILDLALRAREILDTERRLADLEKKLEGGTWQRRA